MKFGFLFLFFRLSRGSFVLALSQDWRQLRGVDRRKWLCHIGYGVVVVVVVVLAVNVAVVFVAVVVAVALVVL